MNRLARLALAALPLVGCRDISAPDPNLPYRLEITPPARGIALKEQHALRVTAYTYSGLPLTIPGITWTSNDTSIAAVDANGVVTGRGLGYAYIAATGGGLNAAITIHVRPAALRITMDPPVLAVGDTGIISLARLDYYGDVIASDESGAWWEWDDNNIVEFLHRIPGQPENKLFVVGKTPGQLFIWADGVGVSSGFWITVAATASR